MGPILMIPVGVFTRNLLSENGRTDMDQITNHAATLRHKQGTLRTQMLYQFLMNSVTTDFKTKLIPHLAEFRINEKPIGPCLFKKMVQPTYIDTMAMGSHITKILMDMHLNLIPFQHNMTKFNDWIHNRSGRISFKRSRSK